MKCPRCGGKMILEKYYTSFGSWFGWHCIFCGEIIDPLILANRKEHIEKYHPARSRRSRVVESEVH